MSPHRRPARQIASIDQLLLFDVDLAPADTSAPPSQSKVPKRAPRNVQAPGSTIGNALEFYRLADLMRIFGYADISSFRAWRKRAEAQGFPSPLPGCSRPLKWDRRQVDAWRSGDRRDVDDVLTSPSEVDVIALAREKLRLKAAVRI